jgi:hypothetical protein
MFELGARAEARASELTRQARSWFERGANAGSLDAALAVVRLAVSDRRYDLAAVLLVDARNRHPGLAPERLVAVAPDVLGGGLALDGDGSHDEGDAVFTVLSYYPRRAAAAVARVAPRLMDVDENGVEKPGEQREREYRPGVYEPYTPNFLWDVKWSSHGAYVHLDTKGGLTAAMGRAMVAILVEALATDAVPAFLAGKLPDLTGSWTVWKQPDPPA